jgi:hypothetical protein
LDSALPGSYQGSAVSDSLARFAKVLKESLDKTIRVDSTIFTNTAAGAVSPRTIRKSALQVLTAIQDVDNVNHDVHYVDTMLQNSYGIAAGVSQLLGLSSQSTVSAIVNECRPLGYEGLLGKWNQFFQLNPQLRGSKPETFFQTFVVPNVSGFEASKTAQLRLQYFLGELTFIPPPWSGLSSTYVSLVRALTLHELEPVISNLSITTLQTQLLVCATERLIHDTFVLEFCTDVHGPLVLSD